MGVGEQANLVHLIDFGLSKEFTNPKTHVHIPDGWFAFKYVLLPQALPWQKAPKKVK
jgi:hypothetical protein